MTEMFNEFGEAFSFYVCVAHKICRSIAIVRQIYFCDTNCFSYDFVYMFHILLYYINLY